MIETFNPSKVDQYIYYAPIIHNDGAFYVFGGYTDKNYFETRIGKLDAKIKLICEE